VAMDNTESPPLSSSTSSSTTAAKGLSPTELQSTPTERAKVAMDITESPLLSSSTNSSSAKGLSPTKLQSTLTIGGEQAKVAMLLSSSTSSSSDDGVIQHPSPRVSTHVHRLGYSLVHPLCVTAIMCTHNTVWLVIFMEC
jgi:hypothetical protein